MGIDKIKLGPRSRLLEKKELDAMVDDMVALHPPLPGPVNPSNVRGCGCGQFHVPAGSEAGVEIDGAVHRYAKPCYREEAGERVYYNSPGKRPSIEERVTALEKVVADILAERDTTAEEVRADLAFDAAREDRTFGRHR